MKEFQWRILQHILGSKEKWPLKNGFKMNSNKDYKMYSKQHLKAESSKNYSNKCMLMIQQNKRTEKILHLKNFKMKRKK